MLLLHSVGSEHHGASSVPLGHGGRHDFRDQTQDLLPLRFFILASEARQRTELEDFDRLVVVLPDRRLIGFAASFSAVVGRAVEPRAFELPGNQAANFAGDVRVHEGHEAGELLGVGWREQQVVVVREEDHGMGDHVVHLLGVAKNAKDRLVGGWARPQEQPTMDGAGGDFDEGSGSGYEP